MRNANNILIVGVGGQGTILAGDILAEAAMLRGYDVKKSEIHGMSQRGGSVFCHVRFGEKIYSPVIPKGETDYLISLEEMESLRWIEYLNHDSKIIMLRHRILPDTAETYPEGIIEALKQKFSNFSSFDPKIIAERIGNTKVLNSFALGVLSKTTDIEETHWLTSLEKWVPRGTFEDNKKAFLEGVKG